jgi:hypothetical protein
MLPALDEHAVEIGAAPSVVWPALLAVVQRTFSSPGAAAYARAVGCEPAAAGGPRPLDRGSAVPGFRVAGAVPAVELRLEGRHRFSAYALIFRLDDLGAGRSRLRAESRAEFPGVAGRLYRMVLLRSGGHVAGMRRLLAGVKRRSEAGPADRSR